MPDPPFETFLTSCGLNGLRQKGCCILVKNRYFCDPFLKKLPVMVILVPVMIRPSGSRGFWGNWTLEAVEASELAEATEVNDAGEVFKAWNITTEDFRVVFVLQFNNLRTNITLFWCFKKQSSLDRIMNLMLNFSPFSVRGRWGCMRSKKVKIVDQT